MRYRFIAVFLAVAVLVPMSTAQARPDGVAGTVDATRTSAAAWTRATAAALPGAEPLVQPLRFAAFTVDGAALRDVLTQAPTEAAGAAAGALVIAVPSPDGDFERFAVTQSPVMEPGLAAAHPEITTYAGRGIDDPAATIRASLTPLGFHASVHADGHAWYVDPRYRGDAEHHVAYHRGVLASPPALHIKREPVGEDHDHGDEAIDAAAQAEAAAGRVPLRIYRLALVTDPSYARNSGANDGLDPDAPDYLEQLSDRVTAAKAVLMNRVNQVYEADFGIRMILVDATDRTNLNTAEMATGANGPCGVDPCYPSANVSSCSSGGLTRTNTVAGLLVGARNYDIGHLGLGVNGGGIAQLGVVGDTNKARGCTGLPRPVGDYFAIDYVAHEMGHQFAANHTFDGTQGSCAASNRNLTGAAAVEPGSGSSVMAYAGICQLDDLQAHTDPYFSQASTREITTYIGSETQRSSVQLVALRDFDGSDTFTLGYGTQRTAAITRGVDYTAAGIKAALEPILPDEGTVTVANVTDSGFQVTFGGGLADVEVALLDVAATGADGFVGELVAGGPTRRGGTPIASQNTAPAVTTTPAFTIPVQTPFTLTAEGSDADGDELTYLWEQNNSALPAVGSSIFQPVRSVGPLFRVFGTAARYANPDDTYLSPSPGQNLATTEPARTFPDLAQILVDNTNARTGVCSQAPSNPESASDAAVDCWSEFLPTPSWVGAAGDSVLRFRVTVRDNHPGAGGSAYADTALTLAKGAGPFRVLDLPAVTPAAPGTLPVQWDVARTDVLTNTPNVRILLSVDGGQTFPHVLSESTPNDGSETLPLPAGISTTKGRVKVEAVGNVFFDVSHSDLTISAL